MQFLQFACSTWLFQVAWLCRIAAALCCRTLAELGFRHGMNYIVPVWTLLSPLRTKEVGVLLPPSEPCRCGGLGQVLKLSVVKDVGRP